MSTSTKGRLSIGAREVHVWSLRRDQHALERLARVLSAHELCHTERSDADRRRCVAAHGLLRLLLAHDTGGVRVHRGTGDPLRSGLRAPGAAA